MQAGEPFVVLQFVLALYHSSEALGFLYLQVRSVRGPYGVVLETGGGRRVFWW